MDSGYKKYYNEWTFTVSVFAKKKKKKKALKAQASKIPNWKRAKSMVKQTPNEV